jgi:hypothetical protein
MVSAAVVTVIVILAVLLAFWFFPPFNASSAIRNAFDWLSATTHSDFRNGGLNRVGLHYELIV